MKVFLFSGVHGVGKGFFLKKIKNNVQQYSIYSASSLIERYQPSTDAGYKKVSNVNNNQDVLIKAIKEEINCSISNFIIDGHLCIFNAKGEVVRVPEYFFIETQINGIIILQDNPEMICNRISQRDTKVISVNDIKKMQEEEKKYANELYNKFKINNFVISHKCTGEQFNEILRRLGGDDNE